MESPQSRIWTVVIFLMLSAIDVAFNAAAGSAAVATGAQVNGSPLTAEAVRIGATAGATKAGLLAFVGFLGFANLDITAYVLLIAIASVFGVCVIITAQVTQAVLGETPTEFLIAAVVAAIPLFWEGTGVYFATTNAYKDEPEDVFGGSKKADVNERWSLVDLLSTAGLDALGGYTFARMLQNQGKPICDLKSAAAAGAVYGVLSCIPKILASIVWALKSSM